LIDWKMGVTNKTTGKPQPAAWMDFGWDLDHRITTADDSKNSTGSCHRAIGSLTTMLQDGNEGRDNNFGQHVATALKSLNGGYEDSVSANTQRTRAFFELENFTLVDNAQVPGTLHVGDVTISFPEGRVSGGYWVSGATDIRLPGVLTDVGTAVGIHAALVTMKTDGTDGTLAGVIPRPELLSARDSLIRHAGICVDDPAMAESISSTLTTSVDLVDGAPSFQDATRPCDSISIGIGFTAQTTRRPAPHSEPDLDPCTK
jgi:hypothetical protein